MTLASSVVIFEFGANDSCQLGPLYSVVSGEVTFAAGRVPANGYWWTVASKPLSRRTPARYSAAASSSGRPERRGPMSTARCLTVSNEFVASNCEMMSSS